MSVGSTKTSHPIGTPRPRGGQSWFFLHIPKTGGTSFQSILDQWFPIENTCPAHTWEQLFEKPLSSLQRYQLVSGHFTNFIEPLLKPQTNWMTFVRDPIERALSQLHYLITHPGNEFWSSRKNLKKEIPSILFETRYPHQISNLQTNTLNSPEDLESILNGLAVKAKDDRLTEIRTLKGPKPGTPQRSPSQSLEAAKKRLEKMWFFGITERFSDSIALLAHQMGWPEIKIFQKEREEPNRPQAKDLSSDCLNRLLEINQADTQLYRYAQELFEERFRKAFKGRKPADILNRKYYRRPLPFRRPRRSHNEGYFSFETVLPNHGWHIAEKGITKILRRWSGPGTESIIDLRLPHPKNPVIRVLVTAFLEPDLLDTLELMINGIPIRITAIPNQTLPGHTLEGPVPEKAYARPQAGYWDRMVFRLPRCRKPSEMNPTSTDSRLLGFQVQKLSVQSSSSPYNS